MSKLTIFATLATILLNQVVPMAAQLVGCDAVNCDTSHPLPLCKLGNVTAVRIGITSFNTTLNPQPLTWTLGIEEREDSPRSETAFFDRDYFLGTPEDLDLAGTSTIYGCALFFEGVSEFLKFPGTNPEFDSGTCGDALTASCVGDLSSQAAATMANLLRNSTKTNQTEACNALRTALQDTAPESCIVATNRQWGTIVVRKLTGNEAAPVIQQPVCHATTGENYKISLVESYTKHISIDYAIIQPFLGGVTPVMTVFSSNIPANASSLLAEAHLSCLKVIGSLAGQTGGKQSKAGRKLVVSGYVVATALLACFLILLT